MHRRELLSLIAAVTGTAMIGATPALAYRQTQAGPNAFTDADAAFLDAVAETIIPATDTPGARDAGVGAFMTVFVSDCYTADERAAFRAGMDSLRAAAQSAAGKDFMDMTDAERRDFLQGAADDARAQAAVVEEARERARASQNVQPAADTAGEQTTATAEAAPQLHWYTPLEQLTLFGFFTSEPGATQVLRYEAIPGEYIGDLDYDGGPAWAT